MPDRFQFSQKSVRTRRIMTLLVRRVFAFNTYEKIMQVLFKKIFMHVNPADSQYFITRFDEVFARC